MNAENTESGARKPRLGLNHYTVQREEERERAESRIPEHKWWWWDGRVGVARFYSTLSHHTVGRQPTGDDRPCTIIHSTQAESNDQEES